MAQKLQKILQICVRSFANPHPVFYFQGTVNPVYNDHPQKSGRC